MTLPTSTRVTDPYETDGVQRDFEFDFPAFYNADTGHYGIEVRRLTALDYEVIDKSLYDIFLNDEDKSGYIRFHVAPMAGDDIYIAGDTTRSQQLNLINYGRYSAQSIEKAFDLIVALIQEFVSKVDEETRQRILADQALRDFLLIKFNQFTAEVTTKIDKHIGDINGFMSSLIPMFVCIMRKEIAYYAETQLDGIIDAKLSDLSTQVANAVAENDAALIRLNESILKIEAATTATAIGARLFDTPAAGVHPVTGVANGAYFNVRSPNAESYVDEYQNVGGSAVSTGKRYLSALGVQLQEKPASTIKDSSGKNQQEINSKIFKEMVSVADFGAKGDDNQTVYDVTPYKTDKDKGITITQQTADGIAFNAAIKWLRNRGGGSLYIPPCATGKSYRVWGYLESIDFPCVIYGAGASSLIKNCDTSPTDRNGYGIFVIQPKNGEEISFLNIKLDGVADIRAKPTSEHRIYPIVIYGDPKFRAFGLTSINSPIDCLNVNFDTSYIDNNTFATFVSCYFDNSYRNTITCGKGENIKFTDCIVSRGGWVHGGTQPRYCVDIEPNFSSITVKTQWVNCTFSHGFNVLVGGVWTESIFTGCLFDASFVHPNNIDKPSFPWVFQMTAGRWDVDNCVFVGRSDYMRNQCHHFNAYNDSYAITNDSYLRIKNSTFRQCGLISSGRSVSIENCFGQLSMCPWYFQGGTAAPKHDVFIKNLRLVNVFDGNNQGGGSFSSFTLAKTILGTIDIDGLSCEVDASSLNQIPATLFDSYQSQYGIWIPAESGSNGNRCSIKNVHCEGYYNRLHTYLGIAKSTAQRRDWGRPNLPPANTAVVSSTVTASLTNGAVANNAVTNTAVAGTATQVDTIANRTLGGRTTPYYKDCTMWGDYA